MRREEIHTLKDKWDKSFSLNQVANRLGFSEEVATNLIELGVLTPVRGPLVDGGNIWLIESDSVEALITAFDEQVILCEGTAGLVNLVRATQILATIGVNSAALIKRVVDKKLVGIRTSYRLWNAGKVLFRKADLSQLALEIQEQNGWVTRLWVAKKMGVKDVIVTKWARSGLIKSQTHCGSAVYFDRYEMEKFASEHIFSDAVARRLKRSVLTIQQWAKVGKLKPVSGPSIDGCHRYLFRLQDLIKLE